MTTIEDVFCSGVYENWREKRVNKIIQLFGKDFFRGKSILEVGCGNGEIGRSFSEMGAKVTQTEGRTDLVENIKKKYPNSDIMTLDNDSLWNLNKKFDIVIHWGLLYHLNNWQQDLVCTLHHCTQYLFLESEISDSEDPFYNHKVTEPDWKDQSLHRLGSRPSAAFVENFLKQLNIKNINRYDDEDLDTEENIYSWKSKNVGYWTKPGMRRFWIVEK